MTLHYHSALYFFLSAYPLPALNIWMSLCSCSYFAQILEEHGPLVAEEPLLVGELVNFPPVAQIKIQEAGGFEPFLLESLRFIKIGGSIGLAEHEVFLHQTGHGASLDELDNLDVIVDTNTSSPDLYIPALTRYPDSYSSASTEVHPILPSPYVFASTSPPQLVHPAGGVTFIDNNPSYQLSNSDSQPQDPCFLSNNKEEDLDLYSGEGDGGVLENDPSSSEVSSATTEESFLRKQAAAQVMATFLLKKLDEIFKNINAG